MVFKELNPGVWKYEKKGASIEGVLINIVPKEGQNSSRYYLDSPKGPILVWGSTVLDDRMRLAKIGDLIKIEYCGLGEAAKGKNAPKLFKVFIDDGQK